MIAVLSGQLSYDIGGLFIFFALAVLLGLATWLSATVRDQPGWIVYGVLTAFFLVPAIIFYPKVIDLTGQRGIFLTVVIPLLGLVWFIGSGIGFLFRGVRAVMLRAR